MLSTDAVPVDPTQQDQLRRLALMQGRLPLGSAAIPSTATLAAPPSPTAAVPVTPPGRTAAPSSKDQLRRLGLSQRRSPNVSVDVPSTTAMLSAPLSPSSVVPVTPPARMTAPAAPSAAPPVTSPGVPAGVPAEAKQALGGITPVDTGSTLGPRPTADLYAPKPLTGGKKALGALFAGMGAFRSPQLGEDIYREEFVDPEKRGQQRFQQANTEYDKRASEKSAQENQRSEEGLRSAQTDEAEQRLANLKEKPSDKFLYHDTDENGNAVAVFQGKDGAYTKPLDYQPAGKKTEPTNPFEAFAYGTPEERKAAQDFLTLEKRTGAQYRNPSEIDERYSLYKRDPDAYKAMFGNRGDAQDQANSARTQAQAARMLKYFDGQRKEIQNSFMMDDTEKQQRLSEIDQLEKPYQDAAQVKPGATDESDTIQVINPNGTTGTIPVSNIKKALGKGYKVAPNQ